MSILVLQEFVRQNHVKEKDGVYENIFAYTDMGKRLREKLKNVGLAPTEFYFDYAYNKIPAPKKVDTKSGRIINYKEPTLAERKEPQKELVKRIIATKPEMVIPTGNIGCKLLLGQAAITRLRGIPEQVTLTDEETQETHTFWVLPMYSMEYVTAKPNVEGLQEADFTTLNRYIVQGDKAFEPEIVDYEFVTTIERVREIFKFIEDFKPLTSWDLETNTLKPEIKGAKALVTSLSWAEGQGLTIPLEHKDWKGWSPEQLEEVYAHLERFVGDASIIKVGHNLQYDIRFLRSTRGMRVFKKNRDTKVGYYLAVTQKLEASFKLSDLAYEMTDMGGYDKALEEYKKKYKQETLEANKAEIDVEKEAEKTRIATEYTEATAEYKATMQELKKEKKSTLHLSPPVKEKIKTFPKAEARKNEVDGGDFNYEWIPLELLHPYASGDVDCCLRIHNKLIKIIEQNEQMHFQFTEFYPQLISALATVESNGIMADRDYMEFINKEYTKKEEELIEEMRELEPVKQLEEEHLLLYETGLEEWTKPKADRDPEVAKLKDSYKKKLKFNPNSSDDKGKVLYRILGITLPYGKETIKQGAFDSGKPEREIEWSDYKADTNALDYIIQNYPEGVEIAKLMAEHSKVRTLKNNFTAKLLNFISNKDHRVHGSFNATGTETTRLSSNNPNMQQVPSKTGDPSRFDYTYPIKRMFTSSFKDGALIQLDYSSLEMRILALAAGDEAMTQAFLDGADLHKETASIVWGVPVEEISGDLRKKAKAVNFGIAYGETPFSIAPKLGITPKEAEEIFDKYFANKPRIKEFIDETHKQALRDGYVDTLQGHRRLIREALSKDKQAVNGALRQSVNTKIQGTGAYCTNMALVYINDYIYSKGLRSKIVLTVHDSIVIDAPKEEINHIASVAKTIMENLPIDFLTIDWKGGKLRYPIEADVEIGVNYNDMTEYAEADFNQFNSVTGYVKYNKDQNKFREYQDNGLISKEDMEKGIAIIENSKSAYQQIV